jgi:predicted metal-dependent hydrolase
MGVSLVAVAKPRHLSVMPAQAGIQSPSPPSLDSRFRGNDATCPFLPEHGSRRATKVERLNGSCYFKSRVMDARLREGISLFNEGRFFESHEAWESLYQDTEAANKPFLEGLIQLAAAFRLVRDFGELKGPVRMIYQALIRLENYQPAFLHIRVQKLCVAMEAWAKEAEAAGAPPSPATIPKIQLKRFKWLS